MSKARDLATTVVGALGGADTDTIFGVPGGGANLEVIGAGADEGMRFVLTHGETAACIAAGTYGLLRGQPGCATVTRGPGAASAVNGLAQATLDRFPLVLVSDVVPAAQRGRVAHQRLDQRAMLRPVAKWSGTIGSGNAAAVAAHAVQLAMSAPRGGVHLDFDPSAPSDDPPDVPPAPAVPDGAVMARAGALLADARRPVLLVGAEAWPWSAEVRSFVERTGCPVLTTYQARGLVPDTSPHVAGVFTNAEIDRALVGRADLVVAVGLDPVEPIPAAWDHEAPVLSLMPWSPTDRYYEPAVEVVGVVGPALAQLQDHARATGWEQGAAAAARRHARQLLLEVATADLDPADVVRVLDAAVPDDATITIDAGAHMLVAVPLLTATPARRMLISNGLATMGFAVPAAIGAALAEPGRPIVALTGDGGLGMALAELETIARLDLPVTVVVFNDAALSLIEIKQGAGHGGSGAVRYSDTDFAAVARASGMAATRVDSVEGLEAAVGRDWRGPRLIDCRVNPTSYRHVLRATRG